MRAFPTQTWTNDGNGKIANYQEEGMDLRDYFAAKAMDAMISNPSDEKRSYDCYAERAYKMADAMMEAMKK